MRPLRRWLHAALAALALLPGPAWAQTPAAEPECPPQPAPLDEAAVREGMQQARDHGLLWRVEKDGRSSWLYGTIHIAERGWMFPGPALLQALREADQLAFELDLTDPAILARLQKGMLAPAGQPPLPPALAQRLAAQARAQCAGNTLDALRPEMQAMTLLALAGRRLGLEPAYGVDLFLEGLARGAGKPAVSLESPEEQLAVLTHDDPAATQAQVSDILDDLERPHGLEILARMARGWSQSNLADLSKYAQWCECMDTPSQRRLYQRMVDERNLTMAARIHALHTAGKRTLVAVGALHLVGPQGVPALLQARGYKLTQLLPR